MNAVAFMLKQEFSLVRWEMMFFPDCRTFESCRQVKSLSSMFMLMCFSTNSQKSNLYGKFGKSFPILLR